MPESIRPPLPDISSATNKGNGSVELIWSAVKEAESYNIYVNGEKVPTYYVNGSRLRVPEEYIADGDTVVVNQMGSGDSVFRSTPEYFYNDPNTQNTEMLE